MTELQALTAKRDELLAKLKEITGISEGADDATVQALNLQQAQLTAQQSDLQTKLKEVKSQLSSLTAEIKKLSESGVDRILEAIKNQRWYFFKNKPKVLMDRDTGWLWANLKYYQHEVHDRTQKNSIEEKNTLYSPFIINFVVDRDGWFFPNDSNNRKEITTILHDLFVLDGYTNWTVPRNKDIESLTAGNFPFSNLNQENMYWICETNGSYSLFICNHYMNYVETRRNQKSHILPCNTQLVEGTDYAAKVSPEHSVYTEKERLQFTLDLFVENGFLPLFDDEEITQIYEKIYFKKPELLKQLEEVQSQIEALQVTELLSSEFDYTAMLTKYDMKAVNGSIIQYYQAVQHWVTELLDKLDDYEQEIEPVLHDFSAISLKLSKKYEDTPNLTDEENTLLAERQRYFQKRFSLEMSSVKSKLLSIKKQADKLESRIDEIDSGEDAIRELALLEKEERASFEFLAENTAKIVRNALLKIEYFQDNRPFIMKAIDVWEKWSENYRVFKTTYRENLKASCENDSIEEEVWKPWYEDWRSIRFAIEQKIQPIIERGLKSVIPTVTDTEVSVPELLIATLEQYKDSIDKFFMEERKGVYQKFVFQAGGELQDKFETESELYKRTAAFQSALQEIIFNCANSEDRIFILKWANTLLDIQVDEILTFVADNDLQKISQTILSEFAALKQKNYDTYLADAEAYGKEKARREKEYNSLIFKMRKDLAKQ